MAWEDLEQDIAEEFGLCVPELTLYEDRRNQRTMHIICAPKPQPRTARRAVVCAAAQNRWRRKNAKVRREVEFLALGRTVCAFPSCSNLLIPPWCLRNGRVSATCDRAHSNEFAALKRKQARQPKGGVSASGPGPVEPREPPSG